MIVDGSTDPSITENEMVYFQSCQKGIIKTDFVQCCQVQRGTTSGIVHAIERAVQTVMTLPQFVNILVALGSDGPLVMLGKMVVLLLF